MAADRTASSHRPRSRGARAAVATGVPAVVTAIGLGIGETRTTAVALLYLLGVLVVATSSGALAGTAAAALSFLGLNFFFTPPRRTLAVGKTDDLIALFVFLCVSLVVSSLVTVGLTHRARARRMEEEAAAMYAISSRLADVDDAGDAIGAVLEDVRALLGLRWCQIEVGEGSFAAGERPAGDTIDLPLRAGETDVGWFRLAPQAAFGEAERRVAVVLARQIALAHQRTSLAREATAVRAAAEANKMRGALLSAVSHDFRTPLASIVASLTALLPDPAQVGPEATAELLRTALEEAERLDRLVTNLLDIARLRAGAIAPERLPVDAEELIDDAVASLRAHLAGHEVTVSVRADVPKLHADPVQIGQVLKNILQNAARFAPAGSEIRVTAVPWPGAVEIRVADLGPGIPPADRDAVFEEFFRGEGARAGTGLGLAMAKAIVSAHGGQIWVEGTPQGGATVAFRIPAARSAA